MVCLVVVAPSGAAAEDSEEPIIVIEAEADTDPSAQDDDAIVLEGEEQIELGEDGTLILKDDEARIYIGRKRPRAGSWEIRGKHGSHDRVLWGTDLTIGEDEHIEGAAVVIGGSIVVDGNVEGDCVAIGGGVEVRGHVGGNVVAIGGSADLDPEAVCRGDVVAIGGHVQQHGAEVTGEIVSIGFLPMWGPLLPASNILLLLVAMSFGIYVVICVILGTVLRKNTTRMIEEVAERPFWSFWVGLAFHVVSQIVIFLLTVTLIGAPLALLGGVLWWLVAQLGQVLAGIRFGQLILRRGPFERQVFPGLLTGLLLHAILLIAALTYTASTFAALTVGTIGIGVQLVFVCIGTGALFTSRFGEDREKRAAPAPNQPLFQSAPQGPEGT